MCGHKYRSRMSNPWRSFSGLFWIIGLIILASHNWWWPGIFILIGLSMVMSSAFSGSGASQTLEGGTPPKPVSVPSISQQPATHQPLAPEPPACTNRSDLLPATCPRCGGPVRLAEVTWRGPQSASCAYCGSNLPMGKTK